MNKPNAIPAPYSAALLLDDGEVFFGFGIGTHGSTFGEICFNTAITGYQEVLTDPSYAGQIITFTFPHIGNIGTNTEDIESLVPSVRGLIVREAITTPSNFRSNQSLARWLEDKNITGISGIDTRALTRHIRLKGAQNVAILYPKAGESSDLAALKVKLSEVPSLKGLELAAEASCKKPYEWNQTRWALEHGYGKLEKPEFHVVAIDYGEKLNILRCLASIGCKITVVPAATPAAEILALKPNGVFLSNGPGDPAATGKYALPIINELIASGLPIFGICLGHQLLGQALGGKTEKMHQGHRGANHPVKDLKSGNVIITSQNHGFVVSKDGLPDDVEITHISLFDQTIQGLAHKTKPLFCVQGHPEASPGPHDSLYLFEQFTRLMRNHAKA